jgi:hypothetical protein
MGPVNNCMLLMVTVSLPRILFATGIAVFAISVPGFLYVAATSGREVVSLESIKLSATGAFVIALATVSFVGVLGAAQGILSNLLRMRGLVKPSIGAFDRRLLFNPYNAIFLPQHLTDEGLQARKRMLGYSVILVASVATGFVIVWLVRA